MTTEYESISYYSDKYVALETKMEIILKNVM